MEGTGPALTLRTILSFLLLILLQSSAEAQICRAPDQLDFPENNEPGALVQTIATDPGVNLTLEAPTEGERAAFSLEGNRLLANYSFDYETKKNHIANIECVSPSGSSLSIVIVVLVTNLNDNPPVFDPTTYDIDVNELLPVNTFIRNFPATDKDGPPLYYTLTSDPDVNGFKLSGDSNPGLVVDRPLEYDKVKSVRLTLKAQDTPLDQPDVTPSNTATATITVTILDVDNRPPFFQPCNPQEVGGTLVCLSQGYSGRVVLGEQQAGALELDPGPVYAIDGDSNINVGMSYSFLSENNLFSIDADTGNITMTRPANEPGTISLTVVAAQKINTYQFATTTVSINVHAKSLHRPQFQKREYDAVVTGAGGLAMDSSNKDQPIRILATDQDYNANEGINPHITYTIEGDNNFTIVSGFLFLTQSLPESTFSLQVLATDTENGETDRAALSVQVTSVPSTTALPQTTTDNMSTGSSATTDVTSTTDSTTESTSESTTESTSESTMESTTDSTSDSTTDPSVTSEGGVSTAATAPPVTVVVPSGGYGSVEMAAVGATLGVLLFGSLVAIAVLVVKLQRGKADWKKIYETNVFRSSLGNGSGGQKDGIQYTNDAFQKDEDGGSTGSSDQEEGKAKTVGEPKTLGFALHEIAKSSGSKEAAQPQPDGTSEAGSDHSDNDKEVKPILTKERRVDEGYKSVWFKEDITPDAKEEVVIIPDSREDDSEEEDDDDDHNKPRKSKVVFNETDLDSGLGVRMEDPGDSDEDHL